MEAATVFSASLFAGPGLDLAQVLVVIVCRNREDHISPSKLALKVATHSIGALGN